MLNMQSARTDDVAAKGFLRESESRVHSMALVHEMLYRGHDLANVDIGAYTEQLCRQLVSAYGIGAQRVELLTRTEPIPFELDRSIPFGLIVNELVSNALKHAFPAGRAGHVHVSLTAASDGLVILEVRDDGVGIDPAVDPLTHPTLGLRLVSALARQLRGSLEVERRAGSAFRVRVPLKRSDEDPPRPSLPRPPR
jgi:two-component sensor histidine kinase